MEPKSFRRCLDCQAPMTWKAQRVQWGRLRRGGIRDPRPHLPRCQTCLTRYVMKLIANSETQRDTYKASANSDTR